MQSLRELFPQYRSTLDPAVSPTHPDPALVELSCRFGRVYLHGPGMLAVECDYHPVIRRQLVALGLTCIQNGDQEATFLCPLEDADKVFAIIKPRLRPKASPALIEAGRAFQFRPGLKVG